MSNLDLKHLLVTGEVNYQSTNRSIILADIIQQQLQQLVRRINQAYLLNVA